MNETHRFGHRLGLIGLTTSLAMAGCMAHTGEDQVGEDVTEVAVSVQALQVQVFSDEFEDSNDPNLGQWTKTGVNARSSSAKHAGNYGVRSDDNASITATVNTTGHSGITVSYWRRTAYYDSGEQFYAEWSANGTSWNLIESTGNNSTWTSRAFTLPASANNLAAMRLRFRSNASGAYETFDLDQIIVTGEDGCTPSCSGTHCGSNGCGGTCGVTCNPGYVCDINVCEYAPAAPALFTEGFESGTGNWTEMHSYDCAESTSAKFSGSYGVRCANDAFNSLTRTQSTLGSKDILVEYRRRTNGFDIGEYLWVEWSADGSSWTELEQIADAVYTYKAFQLPASANNLSALRLRFRSNHSDSLNESFDVDDVAIRGLAMSCTPSCGTAVCGADGCGGSCGTCASGQVCSGGACTCAPSCAGSECGSDGCGGSCGTCGSGESCVTGQCQSSCVPSCSGMECGADGCGGTCGTCNTNESCASGACVCQPSCSGKTCGADGCGGVCGTCGSGLTCSAQGTCQSTLNNPGATGPYSVCSYTANLTDSSYASAIVSYPCSTTGLLAATTLTGGYTNTKEDMAWLKDRVASHGYIVIAMTPNNTWGDTTEWFNAHRGGHAKLLAENNRSASPIFGRVDTSRMQVMGFSKGGGGTLRAAESLGSSIKTAQALAPWLESSRQSTLWNIVAATACYTGNSDTIAPPGNVRTFFGNLPTSIDRIFVRFKDATHGHWYGSDSSSNSTYRTRFATHVISFMKVYLDGNSAYQTYLDGSQYTSQKSGNWYDNPDGSGTSDGYTYFP